MNVVILSPTRGMGRALARLMAERGDRLFLLGRDLDSLERSTADLRVRTSLGDDTPDPIAGLARCDLAEPETFAPALAEARRAMGSVDTVVVTAADFASQEQLEADPERARRLLSVNFTDTVTFCEHARHDLLANGGTLCVFSSVAGDRGRKPVVLYGASKAGLSAYLEGLDHRFRGDGLRTVCVKPGFVRTSMTAELEPPPFASEPESVARRVLKAIDRGWPVVYAPPVWRTIMAIVKRLPRWMMRRVGF